VYNYYSSSVRSMDHNMLLAFFFAILLFIAPFVREIEYSWFYIKIIWWGAIIWLMGFPMFVLFSKRTSNVFPDILGIFSQIITIIEGIRLEDEYGTAPAGYIILPAIGLLAIFGLLISKMRRGERAGPSEAPSSWWW